MRGEVTVNLGELVKVAVRLGSLFDFEDDEGAVVEGVLAAGEAIDFFKNVIGDGICRKALLLGD